MSSLLGTVMLVMVFACLALLSGDGLWSNVIRLINVVTAALLATNYFEPIAAWLDAWQPSFGYLWDYLAIWGLFAFFFSIFRLATDYVSQVQVKFLAVIDKNLSAVFAFWVGWVMVCFTMMSLHTAPLSRTFFFGGFKPEQNMIFGLAPDRQWLGFVQKESLGAFCRSATPEEWEAEKFVFDPNGQFMPTYATRRKGFEENIKKKDSILVAPQN